MELLERLAANDQQLTVLLDVPRSVGMRELTAALALNTTLTTLSLVVRGLVAADALELAGALERNRTLKVLDLSFNNIGDDSRLLAAALERNNSLMMLYAYRNNIGDDGARNLAAALERNNSLTALHLGDNSMGKVGAAALRAALETNCTLDALYGVTGVDDILKRNRGVRVARKQQVTSQFFIIAGIKFLHSASVLLWFCLG
jgi:Ran GTPase-activating protein (RanGAP) involved in mRNA processing and transport